MAAFDHTTGRHATWTPVQIDTLDADAQAMDVALREARNWAALRSASAYRCSLKETARLAVTCPVEVEPTGVKRTLHQVLSGLRQAILK